MGQPIEPTLSSVARIAGELGHELNNELAAVLNYTYVLSRRLGDDAETSEHVGELREAAWRATGLAEHLLTFSHAQRLAPIGTSLETVLRDLEPLLLHGLDPDRMLEIALDDGLHPVTIARSAIESLLLRAALIKHRSGSALGPLFIRGRNARLERGGPGDSTVAEDFVRLDVGPLPLETTDRRTSDGGLSASTEDQLLSDRVRTGLSHLGARLETSRRDDALTVTAYLPASV